VSRVRWRAVLVGREVRLALRVAELLHAARGRRGRAGRGPVARDGPHGGAVRPVRLAPGPRVRRRAPDADGRPVLHELGEPDVRAGGRPGLRTGPSVGRGLPTRRPGAGSTRPGPVGGTRLIRSVDTPGEPARRAEAGARTRR